MAGGFSDLVTEVQRILGMNDLALGKALRPPVSRQTVRNWKNGAKPTLENCQAFATLSGFPLEVVIAARDSEDGSHGQPEAVPGWLTDILIQLSPAEQVYLGQAARGILQLREDRAVTEDSP